MSKSRREFYCKQKEIVQRELLEELDFTREISEEELLEILDTKIQEVALTNGFCLEERKNMRSEIFHSLRQLDILQDLIDDPEVSEIMINGPGKIFCERNGRIEEWNSCFETEEKLNDIIQQIVANCNRVVNETSPIVDARLENGSRVNIVLKPIALNGPIVTIRRFPEKPIDMEKLLELNSVTEELNNFLKKLVVAGYNIFISGGTGAGKTTFLNALSNYIPGDERVITIEDSAELQLQNVKNLVRLETRNSNAEGCSAITVRDLIKSALRMRPDRIVVGEVRGAEAVDLLQALNTGHSGSLSTGHANSAQDMLSRLETMALMGMDIPILAIRQQVASAIDIIIHLGRLRDKSRSVLEVSEIVGFENEHIILNKLYVFDYERNIIVRVGELKNEEKLCAAGMEGIL